MNDKLLLDVAGAAEVLTMSIRSLERRAALGEIPSVKVGGLRRFRIVDLEAFVQNLGDNGAAVGMTPTTARNGDHLRRGHRR
ncbi:MAG: helix-turn-helix domain-containing protein [Candidatus Dormibacteria bacterium]